MFGTCSVALAVWHLQFVSPVSGHVPAGCRSVAATRLLVLSHRLLRLWFDRHSNRLWLSGWLLLLLACLAVSLNTRYSFTLCHTYVCFNQSGTQAPSRLAVDSCVVVRRFQLPHLQFGVLSAGWMRQHCTGCFHTALVFWQAVVVLHCCMWQSDTGGFNRTAQAWHCGCNIYRLHLALRCCTLMRWVATAPL
jgi:hypothetical protein